MAQKSKTLAGILQIVGFFTIGGVGRLYMGYVGIGVAQLVLSFICLGQLWSLIDGILIFAGSPDRDADGTPLE